MKVRKLNKDKGYGGVSGMCKICKTQYTYCFQSEEEEKKWDEYYHKRANGEIAYIQDYMPNMENWFRETQIYRGDGTCICKKCLERRY